MPQTLSAYNPTWRDSIAQWMLGQSAPTPQRRHFVEGLLGSSGLGTTGAGVVDATPIGGLLGAQESAQKGDYKGMALAALPMPAAKARGIIAYHGSPHSFDRFDLSKIGTGEGAQAYGHGLYFAENEPVAETYRYVQQPSYTGLDPHAHAARALKSAHRAGLSGEEAKKAALGYLNEYAQAAGQNDLRQQYYDAMNNFDELTGNKIGNMYQVRINADPEHFLDWDKPLSEQSPVVRDYLHKNGLVDFDNNVGPSSTGEIKPLGWTQNASGMLGENFYRRLTEGKFTPEMFAQGVPKGVAQGEATNALREAGIPGIKYLDQGSRGAGEGSRNYVVFDDKLVEILKKYGIVGLLGGGAALGSSAQQQPEM